MTDVLTTVSFRVKYWTEWGQNLVVVGSHPKLGEWDVRKGIWMHCEVRDAPRRPITAALEHFALLPFTHKD
ncbi:hypothetical protein N9L76_06065 [bacterium]|jgi:hypothetical protein|nr:hypothetical protein [bacterium]|tara:strand:+ start:6337 stop:6549 length:213 start_codon:yes stop_codon:yes gene_type:complete